MKPAEAVDPRSVACAVAGAHHGRMGEVVNLRQIKKRGLRAAEAAEAKQNRVRHGRTKAEKANDQRAEARRTALLDALSRGKPSE